MRHVPLIPIAAALLLLGVGCGTAPSSPTDAPAAIPKSTTVISMTVDGFEPATITVTKGTTVTFTNSDTRFAHWPASAVHPTHSELPGFDAKRAIAPGDSYSFTFETVGTWRFHDHLNIAHTGSVTVTD